VFKSPCIPIVKVCPNPRTHAAKASFPARRARRAGAAEGGLRSTGRHAWDDLRDHVDVYEPVGVLRLNKWIER